MAKLLIAQESLTKVDQKTRKDIQDSFRQEQRHRREQKLKKKTHMIRQLLDNGGSREEIDALLTSIQHDDQGSINTVDDNSVSASESSQDESRCGAVRRITVTPQNDFSPKPAPEPPPKHQKVINITNTIAAELTYSPSVCTPHPYIATMENSEPLPTSLITDSTTTTTTHHHITGPKIVEHTLPAPILQCNWLATIRLMQTAHFAAPVARQMRLHIDGGGQPFHNQ